MTPCDYLTLKFERWWNELMSCRRHEFTIRRGAWSGGLVRATMRRGVDRSEKRRGNFFVIVRRSRKGLSDLESIHLQRFRRPEPFFERLLISECATLPHCHSARSRISLHLGSLISDPSPKGRDHHLELLPTILVLTLRSTSKKGQGKPRIATDTLEHSAQLRLTLRLIIPSDF